MRRALIAAGVFSLTGKNGASVAEPLSAGEVSFYDELLREPILYSSDVPESILQMGRADGNAPAAPSEAPAEGRGGNSAIPRPNADIVIRGNYFVGMITDLTTNMRDYDGKVIQYEGFVKNIDPGLESQESFAVCRMFYCCGDDAYFVGLPCDGYGGEVPEDDGWVVVTGVMGIREDPEGEYPYLEVMEMTSLPEPGEMYVYQ